MTPLQNILIQLQLNTHIGQTGLALNALAEKLIKEAGAEPAFLNFNGFPASLCVSLNETVVHGVPNDKPFEDGDIVKLDLGLKDLATGQFDDGATTFILGKRSKIAAKLVKATFEALEAGCAMAKPGYTTNDIGRAIHQVALRAGLTPVNNYGGHGIGLELHMPPFVPNYSTNPGVVLEAGMRLAIEPMFSTKSPDTHIGEDGFSVVLNSGLAAHYERTVTV